MEESFDSVVCDIMEGDILDVLNTFMDSQSNLFQSTREAQCADYTSDQFQAYQRFCDILEERVSMSCSNESVDPEAFMNACIASIDVSPTVDTFAKILLISTGFQLFDDIMRDVEKRKYMFKIWKDWSNTLVRSTRRK